MFRVSNPGLNLEQGVGRLATSIGNGGDDLAVRRHRAEVRILLDHASAFRPVGHQDDAAEQVVEEPAGVIGSAHEVDDPQHSVGQVCRRFTFLGIQQRIARLLGRCQCGGGALEGAPVTRHPAMQPAFERSLDGDSMLRLHLDQLEQAFPVGVTTDRPATLGTVQQRPQGTELGLQCAQGGLALDDRLARRLDGTLGFRLPLLDARGGLAHIRKLLPRGFGGPASAVELLGQGRMSD